MSATLAALCPHCQQSTTNPDHTRRIAPVGWIATWRCTHCSKSWARYVASTPKRSAA